jgi:hypothetical protein
MTAELQRLMTRGICSCGKVSSMTDCESGIREAPASPCRVRNSTISGTLVAMPQSIEAAVKPMIDSTIILFRPNFIASQPQSGVMTAVARM